MKTIHLFIAFILVAVAQIFIPVQMIRNQESIIDTGVVYKFKTRPVDPTDPFRGKYINLNYDVNTFKTKDTLWAYQQEVYVYLETDSLGFAKASEVSKVQLDVDKDYVMAVANWYNKNEKQLHFRLPFNRYYMEETKAYDAEVAVRNRPGDSIRHTTYALVYVKGGEAVLDDVIIDEISIKDYVENKEGLN